MQRFVKLTDNWLMRGWEDIPFALVHWKSKEVRPITEKIAYVVRSCDGKTDFNTPLCFLPIHKKILEALIKECIVQECREGDILHESQHFRKASNPYVPKIQWALTGDCNLKCQHCYMESPDYKYKDIQQTDIDKILEEFERSNVLEVSITGGEAFMRSDLLDIIKKLTDKRIKIGNLYSNGLLITDKILKEIKVLGVTSTFCLSFDGVGTHDKMRGTKHTEEKVIDAIKRIRSYGFELNIATSIDKFSTVQSVLATYELVKELDVRSWQISAPNDAGNWQAPTSALSLDEEVELYKPILKKWHKEKHPLDIQLGAFFNNKADSINKDKKTASKYSWESSACGACSLSTYLQPDGTLLPCHMLTGTSYHDKMSNVLEKGLSEILGSSNIMDFARTKKGDLLPYNPSCMQCELFEQCGMGCRARSLTHAGNINSKDPIYCEMFQQNHKNNLLSVLDNI